MSEAMTHPNEAELALYAAGDLNWLRQRMADRHVRRCGLCQTVVSEYSEIRSEIGSQAPSLPIAGWKRLETEMKANIRLGLVAGECVYRRPVRSFVSGKRLVVVASVLCCLMVAGIFFQGPGELAVRSRAAFLQNQAFLPNEPTGSPSSSNATILEAAEGGIQVREGRQTLRILNSSNRNVSYTVGAQGELRARSLDPVTGNVSITHVYGE